jgi:hypothetical protein
VGTPSFGAGADYLGAVDALAGQIQDIEVVAPATASSEYSIPRAERGHAVLADNNAPGTANFPDVTLLLENSRVGIA